MDALKSNAKQPPEVLGVCAEGTSDGKTESEKPAVVEELQNSSRKSPPELRGVGEIDAIGHEINPLGKAMTKKQYDKRMSFGEDIAELFPERRVKTNESMQEGEMSGNDLNIKDYKTFLDEFAEKNLSGVSHRNFVGSGIGWKLSSNNMVPDSEKPNYIEKMAIYSAWLKEMRRKSCSA